MVQYFRIQCTVQDKLYMQLQIYQLNFTHFATNFSTSLTPLHTPPTSPFSLHFTFLNLTLSITHFIPLSPLLNLSFVSLLSLHYPLIVYLILYIDQYSVQLIAETIEQFSISNSLHSPIAPTPNFMTRLLTLTYESSLLDKIRQTSQTTSNNHQ